LQEDVKADKLRSLPLYSCRITGWKFVCSRCYDKVYNIHAKSRDHHKLNVINLDVAEYLKSRLLLVIASIESSHRHRAVPVMVEQWKGGIILDPLSFERWPCNGV